MSTDKSEQAKIDYEFGMKYKNIAAKYSVSINTVRSWKTRYKWQRKKCAHTKDVQKEKDVRNKKLLKDKMFESVDANEELTEKQRLFCVFYAKSMNATQAYLNAYGGLKTTAMVSGYNILRNPKIANEIHRLRELMRQHIDLGIDDLLQFLCRVLGANIDDYMVFGNRPEPVIGLGGPVLDKETKEPIMRDTNFVELRPNDQVDTSLIQEIRQGKSGLSIKLIDKKWALEQLTKMLDLMPADRRKADYDQRLLDLKERLVKAKEF